MNRRTMLKRAAGATAGVAATMSTSSAEAAAEGPETLGQGAFRYRPIVGWGRLDRAKVPVED